MGRRRQAALTDTPTARLGDVLSRTRARRVQSPPRSIEADQFPEYPANSGGSRVPVGVLSYRGNIATGEVIETHQETNSTSSRVLSSVNNNAAGNDTGRAVGFEHQKDNSTNTRILASLDHDATPLGAANVTNDASRAVGGPALKTLAVEHYHQKDNSTNSRVLESHATDDVGRAVAAEHQKTNSTTSRVLSSHNTDDAQRAVEAPHQRDNSTTSRVLASVPNDVEGNDASRAVNFEHMKDKAVTGRVLQGHATDNAQRAVDTQHQKDNSTTSRVLASATAEENNANRAVMEDHIRQNSIKTSFGPAGDTIHSKVAQDAIGRRELLSHPTDDGKRGVGPDHIRDQSFDKRHYRKRSLPGEPGPEPVPALAENVRVDGEAVVGTLNTNARLREDNFRENGVAQPVVPPGSLQPGIDGANVGKGTTPWDRMHNRAPKTKLPGTVVYSDNWNDLGQFLRSQAFSQRVRAIIFPHSHDHTHPELHTH